MNKKICICTLAALALMSCSSSGDDEQQGAPPAKHPLIVVVNENPFVDENGNAQAPMRQGTRGPAITTETLSSFFMNYTVNQYEVTKTGTGWAAKPFNWPVANNDESISFYAYNAGTYTSESTNYLSFTVPENARTQTDLLVAKHENISYNDAGGQVSLTFDHACAAVDFELRMSELLSQTHSSLIITDIQLRNVTNNGDYYYTNDEWTNIRGKGEYTLNNSEMTLTKEPQPLTCGTLFMIPQTLGEDAVLCFKYDGKDKTISLKGAEWKKGTRYVMDIVIGKKTLGL